MIFTGLLDGYERLCNACLHLGPGLLEMETEHLSRFSLTWEVLNKHLHQSIIYSDPIIQTNVPIFVSQVIFQQSFQINSPTHKFLALAEIFDSLAKIEIAWFFCFNQEQWNVNKKLSWFSTWTMSENPETVKKVASFIKFLVFLKRVEKA